MERAITPYKPSIPKKWLLFISGIIWFFACAFLIKKGTIYIYYYSHHLLFNVGLGFLSGLLFFSFIFYKVAKKHVNSIIKLDCEKPGIFSYRGINDYFIIAFMIITGLLLWKFQFINTLSLNIFYICMGTALFISSLIFFYHLLFYKKYNFSENSHNS